MAIDRSEISRLVAKAIAHANAGGATPGVKTTNRSKLYYRASPGLFNRNL